MKADPVIIVGSGIAGLWTALKLAPTPVIVLAGSSAGSASSTAWAQGGIAAALGPDDSPELHAADTVAVGCGLVDEAAARAMTASAADQVRALEALGVAFEHDASGAWVLSREAAHRHARVARVGGDQAGAEIIRALIEAARNAEHIELLEGVFGAGLISDPVDGCTGVIARGTDGRLRPMSARAVVLATGGIGGLYAVTTNPPGSQGQALAWAARAGAGIRDAEFVQFHPTAIVTAIVTATGTATVAATGTTTATTSDMGRAPAPLATEALRGDGATLIDRFGHRFMPAHHRDAELAPRDVVARAVFHQIATGHGAFLDARSAIGPSFPRRFPAVFAACMAAGIDPREQPIPVAPAVHYHMGGIATGLDGTTSVRGLFAVGEAACTGVHGANRLASNSLLEALVMGDGAARTIEDRTGKPASARDAGARFEPSTGSLTIPPTLPAAALAALRQAMARDAGVERDAAGLARLIETLDALAHSHGPADPLVAAKLIAVSALERRESRGAHARSDFPDTRTVAEPTYMSLARADAVSSSLRNAAELVG